MHTYLVRNGNKGTLVNATNRTEAVKKVLGIGLREAKKDSNITIKRYIVDLDNRAIESRQAMGEFNNDFIRKYR